MRLFVAAFDPGVTTGWARWYGELGAPDQGLRAVLRAGKLEHGEHRAADTNKFGDWRGEADLASIMIDEVIHWSVANQMLAINKDEMVFVFEDFILRPGPTSGRRSGLASVRLTCYMLDAIRDRYLLMPQIVAQSPSDAKSFLNDDRLKALGWWARGAPHSRDALRHVATYVARRRVAG